MPKVIGINIGGTHISAGVVSKGKVIVEKKVMLNSIKTKKDFLEHLFELIETLKEKRIRGIGIGFPAPIIKGYIPEIQNLSFLNNINLKKAVEKEFNVKCEVENDANCFALGEQIFGTAKGKKNIVGITLGTGLGCGIIINGKIYSGATGAAGEISKIYCEKKGKLENFVNARFVKKISGMEPKELYELAVKGNNKARKIWETYGRNLGKILTVVVDTIDPEIIVLGGKIANAYPYFKKELITEIKKSSFKLTSSKTNIVKSKLKNSTILGAAQLVS